MTITKREVDLSDVVSGKSMLVEFVKDTNGYWFFIVHDEPLHSMYPGFAGYGGKTLRGTLSKMSKQWGSHMDSISKTMLKRDGND